MIIAKFQIDARESFCSLQEEEALERARAEEEALVHVTRSKLL